MALSLRKAILFLALAAAHGAVQTERGLSANGQETGGSRQLSFNASETPTLLIPGIDKGGTSDAYLAILDRGALVAGPTKEVGCLYKSTLAAARECYRSAFCDGETGACEPSCDATPNYMWSFNKDVVRTLSLVAPTSVSVFLLRNPVRRIQSLHNYWKGDARIGPRLGATIDAHVEVELAYLSSPTSKRFLRTLLTDDSRVGDEERFNAYASLNKGLGGWIGEHRPESCRDVTGPSQNVGNSTVAACPVHIPFVSTTLYAPMLRHWIAHMDPNNVAVLESESYFAHGPELLFELFPDPMFARKLLEKSAITNKAVYKTPPLSEKLKGDLYAFFDVPNAALRDLLRNWPSTHARVIPDPHKLGTWWSAPAGRHH